MEAQLALPARRALGEGAVWDAARQRLLWIDVVGGKLFEFDPAAGETTRKIDFRQAIGTVVPRVSGGAVVALLKGVAGVDLETGRLADTLACPEPHIIDNRFNDGKCDPAGRLWVGTVNLNCEGAVGTLYCLFADGRMEPKVRDVTITNGIVWNGAADTMFYIDTPTRRVDAFDYDNATAEIGNRRTAVDLAAEEGYPDGMAIDSQDHLWVAMWAGWGVLRLDPASGAVVQKVRVPAAQVTSCAFGGARLDQLFITTARCGLSAAEREEQPEAGSLFVCDMSGAGVVGVESVAFCG